MTRAKFNSPNQLYKALRVPYSFSEFLDRMKNSFGENFFERLDSNEITYEQIEAVALQKPNVRPRENNTISQTDSLPANNQNASKSNTLKTVLIIGGIGFLAWQFLKRKKS